MKRATLAAAVLMGAGMAWAVEPLPVNQPEVRREGTGERREALTKMELTAFKPEVLGSLTDWTNGSAPTAESLKGKALLIVTWSSWLPTSQQAMTRVAALADKYGKDGLVVIAAHDPRKWDGATAFATEKGIKVLMARDADGKLRQALKSDGDPDLYLVDRAGNLRFADFETDVIERALETVMGETAEAAAAVPGKVADAAKAARDAAGKTTALDTTQPPRKPKVLFAPPSAEQYDMALWPKKNSDEAISSQATDVQGQKLPVDFSQGEWLGDKPDFLGRVVIVYYWGTWCPPCMRVKPTLEDMQHKMKDDLTIVAVSGYGSDEKNKLQVQQYLRHHESPFVHMFDTDGKLAKGPMVRAFPTVFVLSTDGTVRWEGNPLQPDFRQVVEQIIKVDPGVMARRLAEAKAEMGGRGGAANP